MNFFELGEGTQNLLYSKLLSSYDVYKVYNLLLNEKWDGWKPTNVFSIYRSVDELYRSLLKQYCGNEESYNSGNDIHCSSGGNRVGVYNNILYILFDWEQVSHRLGYKDISDVNVSTQINISDTIRNIKIKKLKEVIL